MELLRFITAGSVDDGKSTLIGRLFLDSKAIFTDQMEALQQASERIGADEINLALFTDGLKEERDQGITIDVAYRYFSTPKRKFIIADTPGHIEYTRNMVTGASTCEAAVILVDARKGILEQTKRHTFILSVLQIKKIILAVNKMDLVGYSEEAFKKTADEYRELAGGIGLNEVSFIPISAKDGDNVVTKSGNMGWYRGKTLLSSLEDMKIDYPGEHRPMRYDVQYVLRPHNDQFHDYRGFAGRAVSGVLKVGQKVTILPTFTTTSIKSINLGTRQLEQARTLECAALCLADDLDVSRGSMIVDSRHIPHCDRNLDLILCVLTNKGMQLNTPYDVRHLSAELQGMIMSVEKKIDVNTMQAVPGDGELRANDLAYVRLMLSDDLYYDYYVDNKVTGSMILIDRNTHETVAVGLVTKAV